MFVLLEIRLATQRKASRHRQLLGASKLFQKPHIVLVEFANVGDPVSPHAQSFDAQAKREAGDLFGIVADGPQHVRIDHSRSAELHPTRRSS